MHVEKILFPTDLSEGAEPAKAFALALAEKHGAEVLLFNVVPTHAHDFRQLGDLLSDFLGKLQREAERKLEEEAAGLREQGRIVRHVVVQAPSVFEAVLQRVNTWDPDLIVMAIRGRVGMKRWFLGSVAEKVVRHAPCSVVTVRPPEGEREAVGSVERVVVPIDFSDHSRRAVAAALGLLTDGGSLVLHHVVLNPMLSGLAPSALRLFSEDPSLTKRVRERMEDWMQGQPFEAEITEADDVSRSLLEVAEAKKADLLVMGTRGRTGLDYFLTGSVAEKIVRASPLPVMTVR